MQTRPQRFRQWVRQHWLQLTAAAFWIVVAVSANAYMQTHGISALDLAIQLSNLFSATWYGPLLYIVVYFLRPLTLLPGTPLTLLAGYLYGVWWGLFYALVAGVISAVMPYAFGRWFRDEREPVVQPDNRMAQIIRTMQAHPFQTILTTRFLYLPYDTVNFIAGSLRIPFVPFIVATIVGNTVTDFFVVTIGASVEGSLLQGKLNINPLMLAVSAVIWLMSLLITRLIPRHHTSLAERVS